MGLLDRLFGRRAQSGSGDRHTRDDSYQYVQPPPSDQSGSQGESHHPGHEPGGQQDQGPSQQDQGPGSQDAQSQDPAEYDVQGAGGGGDGGGGGDSGGGGDGGGGGNGGGGGD